MKFNKLQTRFAIVCLISMLIVPSTQSFASTYTVEECQEALVNYAKDFAQKKGSDTHYFVKDYADNLNSERAKAYLRDEGCGRSDHQGDLGMDCVGWVSYAIHHCYGIGSNEQFDYFATPQNGCCSPYFELRTDLDNKKPGDVLISEHHVMIYVGNNQIVDCANASGSAPGVAIRSLPDTAVSYIRLTNTSAIKSLTDSYNGTGIKGGGQVFGKEVDYSKFFFNGIPDGKYSLAGRKNIFEVLINAIKELVNFLTGLIGYLFRGLIIGIISIFDRLINNTVQSLNDAPKSLQETGISATSADDPYSMYRSITIEGLIFNSVDLFDINIFKID